MNDPAPSGLALDGPARPDPDPFPGFDVDEGGDFATEHSSVTFADQLAGGQERAREPESPRGLAGMDE